MLTRLGLALPALFLAGCPPNIFGECQFLNDCPAGEQCQDGTCVDVGIITPINPNPTGNDGGPNNNNNVAEIRPSDLNEQQTIAWMAPDPRAGNQVMFPEYEANGFDLLRVFGLNDANFVPAFELDFNDNLGGCNLDTLTVQVSTETELWLACDIGDSTRLLNADDLTQYNPAPGVSVEIVYPTPGVQDVPRRLLTSRGGASFTSWQMNDGDDAFTLRVADQVSVNFTRIVSFHAIEAGNVPGDHVLVFDRGANQLVPITLNGTLWEASPNLQRLNMPAGTQAVVLLGAINANGTPEVSGQANLAAIVPGEGRIRFFNFEEAIELDNPGTLFEPNLAFLPPAPAATERILLAKTPSGDAIMYAAQTGQRVYRIPLRADADDDVRSYDLEPLDRRVSGLVVASEDEVWLAYGTDPTGPAVERVRVDEIP